MSSKISSRARKRLAQGLAVLTACAVLVPAISAQDGLEALAATQGGVTKNESVYVNLDTSGNVKKTTVSDWLHADASGATVADRSDLSDVQNIKGDEQPRKDGDNLVWTLKGSDLYYQGESSKQVPVTMRVRYYLDGQQTAPSAIAGKSGRVELKISLVNREAHSVQIGGQAKTVYTPFACVVALDLPSKTFSNVATNFGKVISDGTNQAVSFVGFPGLKESLSMIDWSGSKLPDELDVRADAKNFTLGPILMAAAPVPDLDSLKNTSDLSGLTGKLNELIDAGLQLKNATGKLNAGEQAFASGVAELYNGVTTAGGSFGQITAGANKLNSSASDRNKGLPALISGTQSLQSGASQLADGTQSLAGQFGDNGKLSGSVGALSGGASQVSAGLAALLAQFGTTQSGNATLADQINALNQGAGSLSSGAQQLGSGASQYQDLTDGLLFASLGNLYQTITGIYTKVYTQAGLSGSALQQQVASSAQETIAGDLAAVKANADSALTQLGALEQQAAAQGKAPDETAVSQLTSAAALSINLYDMMNVFFTDPAVVSETDSTKKEAVFVGEMQKAGAGGNSGYFYSFAGSDALNQAAQSINAGNVVAAGQSVSAGAAGLASGAAKMAAGTSALAAQLRTAVSGESATLYDSVKALSGGASQVSGGLSQLQVSASKGGELYSGVAALNTGAQQLAGGASTLSAGASGLTQLQGGIAQLTGGLGKFGGGLSQIKGGANELNVNVRKLSSGTSQLDGGMSQFWNQGLSKLQKIPTDKISQALQVKDELIRLSEDYTNFSGAGEGFASSVKFICRTDEIKAPAQAVQAQASSSAQTHESFWQKIVSWFKSLFRAD